MKWNEWADVAAVDALMSSLAGDATTYAHSLIDFKDFSHAELLLRLDERFEAARKLANDKCQLCHAKNRKMRLMISWDRT